MGDAPTKHLQPLPDVRDYESSKLPIPYGKEIIFAGLTYSSAAKFYLHDCGML